MFVVDSAKVQEMLFKHELPTKTFARRAQINAGTALKMIRGGARVNGKTLGKVANFFGVKGSDLLLKEHG